MSKVLVVGGNGYIGSHLKKRFPEFTYIGRKEFDLKEKNKIADFIENIDIDLCIILSSTISYEKTIDFKSEPFTTNVNGLENLLSTLMNKDKKIKIIYFSSMTVYSEDNASPVTEDADLSPLHSYGLSKVYAESLVKYYNLESVVIRIPGIYGGNRKSGLIYNIIHKLKNNEAVDIDTNNLGYWETLHIDDFLDMFENFLKNYSYKNQFEIFNVAYGQKTDIIETISFISKQLNSKSAINVNKKYKDFYLSNNKILRLVNPPKTYQDRLALYINEIK